MHNRIDKQHKQDLSAHTTHQQGGNETDGVQRREANGCNGKEGESARGGTSAVLDSSSAQTQAGRRSRD